MASRVELGWLSVVPYKPVGRVSPIRSGARVCRSRRNQKLSEGESYGAIQNDTTQLVQAIRNPDGPMTHHLHWRMLFLFLCCFDAVHFAVIHKNGVQLVSTIMVLLAEYAKTIRTIPPWKTRQTRAPYPNEVGN